ncbi:uncharacterized protein LOC110092934 [Dendrobium catenatum]|uniref:uncharacterized protein LOC110092934 n=1 Tax=Dendrobium catenatum TaxID=906689 RepID=UPI0009F57B46|nr:uncharacterized protein LOC110092934 [Dendrobium catenatum]XP_020673302.1 uncharacterized protein LOC110092934 [Dendrobium catenatum]
MEEGTINVEVIWRGTKLNVEVNTRWTLGELGKKLVELTNVRPDTLKLLVPQTNTKGSRLLAPFSADNSSVEIQETGIIKGKPVRMMGVFDDEIKEVSQNNTRADLRIAGFEEEDNRLRQLSSYKPSASLKLPQGPYIFCDFHTLELPGIKLNPPPSKALRIMHVLACDPGIIAIMNKHRWRVGIMTELAPVGYVGISPKCILGFNKNHGEEISLRLRTDDLKGFRKYESIKKTLLHELAHMVHSEHDTKFLALEKQLNEEAASLDWSKTRSQTLSGQKVSNHYNNDVDYLLEADDVGHRLGGGSNSFSTARASSVAAAYHRNISSSMSSLSGFQAQNKSVQVDAINDSLDGEYDDERLKYVRDNKNAEPDFDNALMLKNKVDNLVLDGIIHESLASSSEPTMIDVDDNDVSHEEASLSSDEPVSDNGGEEVSVECGNLVQQDSISSLDVGLVKAESDLDCHMRDSDNIELQRIEEPVAAICARIQESIRSLRSELTPHVASLVLQTLLKIIRNIIEHPDELKFRRIKKANAQFQRNVANYKAAMEVLSTVGFIEDVVVDAVGVAEAYLVLKRNDPGLLWLAKSSLEVFIS